MSLLISERSAKCVQNKARRAYSLANKQLFLYLRIVVLHHDLFRYMAGAKNLGL